MQKNNPFLLSKRKRIDAVRNYKHHKFKMILDKQLKHYEKSKLRFETKYENVHTKSNIEEHHKCCDEKNRGIMHFFIHPKILPYNSIAFDNTL